MDDEPDAEYPGDPRHPDHERYLVALGRAVLQASTVAVTCYDLLRVWAGYESSVLDKWDLGRLAKALSEYGVQSASADKPLGSLTQWSMFMSSLEVSRELRNDLIHAWPVRHGLLRRGSRYIAADAWPFYTVKSLEDITASFELTSRLGNGLLYSDGGAHVEAWSIHTQA